MRDILEAEATAAEHEQLLRQFLTTFDLPGVSVAVSVVPTGTLYRVWVGEHSSNFRTIVDAHSALHLLRHYKDLTGDRT